MKRTTVCALFAAAALSSTAHAAQGVRVMGPELKRRLPGRTLDYYIPAVSRWHTWRLGRSGRSTWSWASREYPTRWKIDSDKLCYYNNRRHGWLCGEVYRTGPNKYDVRNFRGRNRVGARFEIRQ
jgi:hypothetical protein